MPQDFHPTSKLRMVQVQLQCHPDGTLRDLAALYVVVLPSGAELQLNKVWNDRSARAQEIAAELLGLAMTEYQQLEGLTGE